MEIVSVNYYLHKDHTSLLKTLMDKYFVFSAAAFITSIVAHFMSLDEQTKSEHLSTLDKSTLDAIRKVGHYTSARIALSLFYPFETFAVAHQLPKSVLLTYIVYLYLENQIELPFITYSQS